MEQLAKAIEEFVVESLLFGQSDMLTPEASLLERRIVDSTGILEIVAFIEEHFRVRVEDEELVPDNFDSIARIAAFVTRKMQAEA